MRIGVWTFTWRLSERWKCWVMNTYGSQETMGLYTIHGAQGAAATLWNLLYIILFKVGIIMSTIGYFLHDTFRLERSAVLVHNTCDKMPGLLHFASDLFFPMKVSVFLFSPMRAYYGAFSGVSDRSLPGQLHPSTSAHVAEAHPLGPGKLTILLPPKRFSFLFFFPRP